jgi:hypothetical protein
MIAAESATDAGARVGAILKIARLAPPTVDARWTAMLQAGLAHENAAVRAASVLASAYVGWPELAPLLGPNAAHSAQAIAWIQHRGSQA